MGPTSYGDPRPSSRQSARTGQGIQSSTTNESTIGTLKEFHKFSDLHPEIRLEIWNNALLGARNTRTVIVNNDRVLPLKHLVSPLLSVNYESRSRARAFYSLKLDVLLAPMLGDEPISRIEETIRNTWGHRGEMPKELYGALIKNVLRTAMAPSAIKEADAAEYRKGAIYISPEHDTLVVGYEFGLHFFIEGKMQMLGETHPGPGDISWNYITSKLPEGAFQETSSLIRVAVTLPDATDPDLRRLFTHEFGPRTPYRAIGHKKTVVNLLWKAQLFPNVRQYYTLLLGMYEYNVFLRRIMNQGGWLPYYTDRWVYYTGKHSAGITVLVNEKEWMKLVQKKKEEAEAANASVQG